MLQACSIMWTVIEQHTPSAQMCQPASVCLLQVVVPRDFYAELANGSGSGHLDVGMVEQVTYSETPEQNICASGPRRCCCKAILGLTACDEQHGSKAWTSPPTCFPMCN